MIRGVFDSSILRHAYIIVLLCPHIFMFQNRCKVEDILLEMDRILRPEGAVIVRDQVDVLIKVKKMAAGMRWNTKLADHEDGPHVSEKILYVVKQYWVGGGDKTE